MPVYPDRACAFVHVPKTGGTSIVRALAAERADYTGSGIWDILQRSQDRATIAASVRRNFGLASFVSFPQQHLPAMALYALVGDAWKGIFSFAVVRNPWDVLVSTYAFARAHAPTMGTSDPDRTELMARCDTFERFVELYPLLRADQTEMIADESGTPIVSAVLRFERLEAEFSEACERLGIDAGLGRENASERASDYRDYFTPRTQRLVAAHFTRDIERFAYRF